MTIELYAYDTPNGRKISVALEEMGLDYQVRMVDLAREEQFSPEYVKSSPISLIPAIVDLDGPDAKSISIFESGAILCYLGEKSRKFWPAAYRDRMVVLQWLMFQMGELGPTAGQVHHFAAIQKAEDRHYGFNRYYQKTLRLYSVMDLHLRDSEYFAGEMSIADFAMLGWVWRHKRHHVDLDKFQNVRRWYDALMNRPGVIRGFSVPLS